MSIASLDYMKKHALLNTTIDIGASKHHSSSNSLQTLETQASATKQEQTMCILDTERIRQLPKMA